VSKFTSNDWVEIEEASDNERMFVALEIEKSKKRPISKIKQACIEYLGNRGITERVKRCAKYKNLWFIQFAGGEDVEVSFEGSCYEPYTDVSLDRMQWTKKFLKSENFVTLIFIYFWRKGFRRFFCPLNIGQMNDNFTPKNAEHFYCKCCDFKCSKKSDWDRHNLTLKHKKNDKRMTNDDKITPKNAEKFICDCGKEYKHRQGLWSHKKKCESAAFTPTESEQPSNNIIVELLKQNKEFKDLIIEQNKQIMELAKEKNTVINNTTNNSNTNNNQFNLQFFLNEQCKDALNLGDFVEQIKLQLSDLDMIGRVGYVEGMSKIFMRNLHALDVFKRPIHCSDLKRETLYVKDKDAWEKENGENIKIKRAIKGIENKNIKQIPFWVKENPASEDFETKKHLEYQNILLEAMGGSTLEDDNKKCDKIIRNIAKEVVIDKK
jgi:hypothetical protein